ncbi:acyl- n-acyltransferase [Moniliophthora roreri MCA 2997]|uniref:Acyl-n-acyltransferase n=2 Tax=Moniliophthora roreri TaxID=221103 RepID=V2X6R2_MONRO|nr:acyl- n-acyltransferase [Moniliophthora roreri MCA 2997]
MSMLFRNGKPFTLEAATESARDKYAHLGFELLPHQPVILGKGKCDLQGLRKPGGEGCKVYCMVNWHPDPQGKGEQKV